MFILKNLNIEVKRNKLMLNCESKQSEHVYIEEFKYRSKANMFVSSNLFQSEANSLYVRIKYRSKAKKVNINLCI